MNTLGSQILGSLCKELVRKGKIDDSGEGQGFGKRPAHPNPTQFL